VDSGNVGSIDVGAVEFLFSIGEIDPVFVLELFPGRLAVREYNSGQ